MERNPWWQNVQGDSGAWKGPVGVKADGGGNIRGQGKVGDMKIHRAVHNRKLDASCREDFCILIVIICMVGWLMQALRGSTTSTAFQAESLSATVAPTATTDEVLRLVDAGCDVNEVEAAGNTPLHSAAFEGWQEGVELLLQLGAKVNASNNAGDTPWHWAMNMGWTDIAAVLEANGASQKKGEVLVPEHVPKVKDFYSKECWAHHPKPYADFLEFKKKERSELEAERKKLVRV